MNMKIIIVGGGISGLSTYLQFRQFFASDPNEFEIKIYEKHIPQESFFSTKGKDYTFEEVSSSTAIVGGGLGVGPNGMKILSELSQKLHDKIVKQGYRCENFVFKSSRGWRLSGQSTKDARMGEEVCVASSRHGIWKCLLEEVGEGVVTYKKIIQVKGREDDKGPRVLFDDGSEEEADLVVGADGVRSVVKTFMLGEDEEYKPVYEGLIGVGGFLSIPCPPEVLTEKSLVFTFGPSGFFGYGPLGEESGMW